MQRNEYFALRGAFKPSNVRLVIVAESPPAAGKYFYNPDGKENEPLFRALMKQLGAEITKKANGLRQFKEAGWVLVDATYEPVDKLNETGRKCVILRDYATLCDDLKQLLGTRWREVPLVLVKKNVCQLLEPKLKETRFNVLNKGRDIYFPASGQQRKFHEQFREIVPQELRGLTPA
jgi:hypothetical protein